MPRRSMAHGGPGTGESQAGRHCGNSWTSPTLARSVGNSHCDTASPHVHRRAQRIDSACSDSAAFGYPRLKQPGRGAGLIRTIVVLVLLSGTARAEMLYKCVGKGGAISYQSRACDPGQRVAQARTYEPESPPSPEQLAARRRKLQRDRAESAYLSNLAGTPRGGATSRASGASIPVRRSSAACEAAKRQREAALDAAGLGRTYDLLSSLDAMVRMRAGSRSASKAGARKADERSSTRNKGDLMKPIAHVMAACIAVATLAACNKAAGPAASAADAVFATTAAPTLSDISGVWRASDGTMVSIVYDDKRLRLLFGTDAIPVQVGAIDDQNHTTNLKVALSDGKPGIWTVSQVFDSSSKESFTLQLTLHDGTQDQLSFVRKISNDDLNVILAAESRIHAGSISEAVGQPEEQPSADVADLAQEVAQPVDSTAGDAVAWAPSFDCAKASTGPERLICSNKELSAADVALAQAYRDARNASNDKAWLSEQQSTWRKTVRDAALDVQCMLNAYEQRSAELKWSPVRFGASRCNEPRNRPFRPTASRFGLIHAVSCKSHQQGNSCFQSQKRNSTPFVTSASRWSPRAPACQAPRLSSRYPAQT